MPSVCSTLEPIRWNFSLTNRLLTVVGVLFIIYFLKFYIFSL